VSSRVITHVYLDPIEAIWLQLAKEVGWRIERSSEVYASTDGEGLVRLGTSSTLDPDDCIAQMIFHELCHVCVQGQLGRAPDWGLDNTSDRDVVREHACLRLQAALADPHGLRDVLAPTTDFREYYDALDAQPLVGRGAAVHLARTGQNWLRGQRWAGRLDEALSCTASIASLATRFGVAKGGARPILWTRVGSPTEGSRSHE